MSTYEVAVSDRATDAVCFTATITPAAWTSRDAGELARDLARCLNPGHVIAVVASTGRADEGSAES